MSASPVEHVVVVIPVRNEEELLARCLSSVSSAVAHLASAHVVVVLDDCDDGSEAIARTFDVELRAIGARSVGAARAIGVAHGLASSPAPRNRTWIACTDADSEVPVGWLTTQVALADAGADVVVGTVRPDPADLTHHQLRSWASTRVEGQPNGHVHGANLGLRASVYHRVGGFSLQPEHEDVDLVARVRSDPGVVVVATDRADVLTSGRSEGRTPGGYAGYLREAFPR